MCPPPPCTHLVTILANSPTAAATSMSMMMSKSVMVFLLRGLHVLLSPILTSTILTPSILSCLLFVLLLLLMLLVLVLQSIGTNSSNHASNHCSQNSAAKFMAYKSATSSADQRCAKTALAFLAWDSCAGCLLVWVGRSTAVV